MIEKPIDYIRFREIYVYVELIKHYPWHKVFEQTILKRQTLKELKRIYYNFSNPIVVGPKTVFSIGPGRRIDLDPTIVRRYSEGSPKVAA